MKTIILTFIILGKLSFAQNKIVIQNDNQSNDAQKKVIVIDNNLNTNESTGGLIGLTEPRYSSAISLGLGYNTSHWKNFSPNFENKSTLFEVSYLKKQSENLDSNFSFSRVFYNVKKEEMLRFYTLGIGRKFYWGDDGLSAILGVNILIGTYRVWDKTEDTNDSVSFDKLDSGILFGFDPRAGLRIRLSNSFYINTEAIYTFFVNHPQNYLGRWSLLISLTHSRN